MIVIGSVLDMGDHTVEVLDNPATTKDRYRIHIVAEPGAPGIDNDFPHIHPTIIETFRCISGDMIAMSGSERMEVAPGERIEVPPGQLHGFVNTGDDLLSVEAEVIFPDGYERTSDLMRFAAIYDRLRREGPVSAKTGEPPVLQMAVLAHAYRDVITTPGVAGAMVPLLSAVGRVRGYRSEFPEYET